jgi:hypothetical protein
MTVVKLNIVPIRTFLYSVTLDVNSLDIKNELDRIDWRKADRMEEGRSKIRWARIHEFGAPALEQMMTYLKSADIKNLMLDTLYADIKFYAEWKMERSRMDACTITSVQIVQDCPGFDSALHVDNRGDVASGMIYLSDLDDERLSTFFYEDQHRNSPIRIPTNFCTGWFAANMATTWHEGGNRSNVNRHSIHYRLRLDI